MEEKTFDSISELENKEKHRAMFFERFGPAGKRSPKVWVAMVNAFGAARVREVEGLTEDQLQKKTQCESYGGQLKEKFRQQRLKKING